MTTTRFGAKLNEFARSGDTRGIGEAESRSLSIVGLLDLSRTGDLVMVERSKVERHDIGCLIAFPDTRREPAIANLVSMLTGTSS